MIKAFKKLRETKKINLIIRRYFFFTWNLVIISIRVNRTDETDILRPFLYKILRIERLGLGFPRTLNITEEGLIRIAKIVGKCYSLRALECEFHG